MPPAADLASSIVGGRAGAETQPPGAPACSAMADGRVSTPLIGITGAPRTYGFEASIKF